MRRADGGGVILDLFSGGGGGWCLAARALGLDSVGIEWDGPSCGTRAVVGLPTIRADVSAYPPEPFVGKVDGICGGPPCQSFSSAGKRAGLDDPRGQMVYEPMRYVRVIRPRWVALEQVPEVLGYWRWIARELREMGYSAWCGILNAADYGVPQVRKRAILLASLDRAAEPPAPTHSKSGADDLFGAGLAKWVTMADALGWDGTVHTNTLTGGGSAEGTREYVRSTDRPSSTVRTNSGGRWRLETHRGQRPDGSTQECDVDQPAPAVSTKSGGQWKVRPSWTYERPSTTVLAQNHLAVTDPTQSFPLSKNAVRVEAWELGVLQGFPADHPWQPPYVSAQIGNAIPPPLAEACLRALVG